MAKILNFRACAAYWHRKRIFSPKLQQKIRKKLPIFSRAPSARIVTHGKADSNPL